MKTYSCKLCLDKGWEMRFADDHTDVIIPEVCHCQSGHELSNEMKIKIHTHNAKLFAQRL